MDKFVNAIADAMGKDLKYYSVQLYSAGVSVQFEEAKIAKGVLSEYATLCKRMESYVALLTDLDKLTLMKSCKFQSSFEWIQRNTLTVLDTLRKKSKEWGISSDDETVTLKFILPLEYRPISTLFDRLSLINKLKDDKWISTEEWSILLEDISNSYIDEVNRLAEIGITNDDTNDFDDTDDFDDIDDTDDTDDTDDPDDFDDTDDFGDEEDYVDEEVDEYEDEDIVEITENIEKITEDSTTVTTEVSAVESGNTVDSGNTVESDNMVESGTVQEAKQGLIEGVASKISLFANDKLKGKNKKHWGKDKKKVAGTAV